MKNYHKIRIKPTLGFGLLITMLIASSFIYGAETGKIAGRVIDASTNQPLIGVNVVVEGTELGAPTDANGRYLITNVRVGTYSVLASYIGYEPVVVKGILVLPDQTATVDFKLNPTVLQIEKPIEVTAEKEVYIRTATATTHVQLAEEFNRLPVITLGQLVGLTAGVLNDDRTGWTHIRGGRFDDVAYFIDGVQSQDALYGTLWSSPRPTTDAIKEVIVITGGFDPEYGEAMSGVIQTVTKEGGEQMEGRIRTLTDAIFPRQDYNFGYIKTGVSLGGAIPGFKRLRYFVSGERIHTPSDADVRYRVPSPRDEYTGEGKLTYKLPKTSITVYGYNSSYEWQGFSNTYQFWMDHVYSNRVRSNKLDFSLNHMLTPVTILTAKAGWFNTKLLRTQRDKASEDGNWFWTDYKFKAEDFVFGKNDTVIDGETIPADPEVRVLKLYKLKEVVNGDTQDMFIQSDYWTNNPYGVYNIFVGKGDYRLWHYRSTDNFYLKGDITHNVRKIHELKAGIDLKRYSLTELTNSLPWDPNPFWEAYTYHPITGAAYIQDRADFENIVVRGGLRLDVLDANVWKKLYPDSVLNRDTVKTSIKVRVSPRLGISFPITERIKFRFSYGHFFKNPVFSDLYESLKALKNLDIIRRGNIIVGNPDLDAEKTIAYETGFDAQLTDYLGFDLTAFYKDVFDLIGTRPVPALPMSYTTYYNVEYGRILGFEIGFNKALMNYWQTSLTYTFQVAKGTAATATDWYFRGGTPIQVDYYLDQDQRHSASLDLGFMFPDDYSVAVMKNANLSLIGRFGTGLPYTPTDLKGNQTGDVNSARYPSSFTVDGRISKSFNLGRFNFDISLDVTNILNTLTINNVNTVTGSPSNSGTIITPGQFTGGMVVGDQYYSAARDFNHDGYLTRQEEYTAYVNAYEAIQNPPTNYGPPRKMKLGLNISF
jgi:outer membrane receptor protein involved in Fe transport